MARLERVQVETMAQANGLKMTPQRRAIIDYLQQAWHHPTAEEIMRAVNERFPMTSRATVYNTLNWLKEAGLVQEVWEGGSVRFDPNTDYHHHFICRKCGGVQDIDAALLGPINLDALGDRQKVETFAVTLRGLCSFCQ